MSMAAALLSPSTILFRIVIDLNSQDGTRIVCHFVDVASERLFA
jgi:hypothetical protein